MAWAAPVAHSGGGGDTAAAPVMALGQELPDIDASAESAAAPAGTGAVARSSAAAASAVALPARTAASAPTSGPASTASSERDWVRAAYKDLAVSSGALEAWQQLNGEKEGGTLDAARPTDPNSMPRRRAETPDGEVAVAGTALPPRTAEQLKIDEEQAAMLTSALIREVTPWVAGGLALLAVVQGVRLVLGRSRKQADRRQAQRRATVRDGVPRRAESE